ncbi:MAG: threonylcarbamoyl-AMP synthase [Lachnospiraceae bacterium]|nr:threonylcarbamoyl-AMP synthase [Lachnospiraceae bacterium]
METKIVNLEKKNKNISLLKEAGEIIKRGGLVAFPTETVYGLGGDGLNPESSKKIYAAKGRPSDNPLIIHISKTEDLEKIVTEVPNNAKLLADKFWPGPLTMVLNKNESVPYETTGGLETVAVRMPSHEMAREFIEYAGGFVAAPSANRSGRPSPTRGKYVVEDMEGRIDMILIDDSIEIGLESTIVDLTGEIPCILRPGIITKEMLEEVVGRVETDRAILNPESKEPPKAPGMKYRHYAPKGELQIIEGEEEKVIAAINRLVMEEEKKGKKVGIIATSQSLACYRQGVIKNAGDRQKEMEITRALYRILREFDEEEVEVIYSEAFTKGEFSQAIMNRLLKAAGYHIIKV